MLPFFRFLIIKIANQKSENKILSKSGRRRKRMKKRNVAKWVGIGVMLCMCAGCGNQKTSADKVLEANQTEIIEQNEKKEEKQTTKQEEVIGQEETEANSKKAEEKKKGTIVVISDFYSEELGTNMAIRIYLPPEYEKSGKNYPVIYMPDGQNLFSSATATYQKEWCMDENIDQFYRKNRTDGMIVVGVDSDSATRNKDYNLYLGAYEGGGEGNAAKVADFFANTLKPYIDENYRTLPERENTSIIGSSYGAVVAIVTSVNYPEVYGYTGAFSYCDNQNPEKMNEYLKANITKEVFAGRKIYFFTGAYDFAYQSTKGAFEIAVENGVENVEFLFDENGQHDEYTWCKYVDDCLEFFGWLQIEE